MMNTIATKFRFQSAIHSFIEFGKRLTHQSFQNVHISRREGKSLKKNISYINEADTLHCTGNDIATPNHKLSLCKVSSNP